MNAAATITAAHPASLGSTWGGVMPVARRAALYVRGGMACAACGHHRRDGAKLSLDHVEAHHTGGTDEDSNLVVLCGVCNSSKQEVPLREWLRAGGSPRGLRASARAVEAAILRQAAAPVCYAFRGAK